MSALIFLVDAFSRLFLMALILRLLLQMARGSFNNPVAQFIVQITNPVVVPARRVLPSVRRFDMPTLVALIALQALVILLIEFLLRGVPPFGTLLVATVIAVLENTVWTYLLGILIFVICSWIGQTYNPIALFFADIIEPLLRPVRRRLPAVSGIDFSPMIIVIFLWAALLLLGDFRLVGR